jgi:excisionase family DNA binding protein
MGDLFYSSGQAAQQLGVSQQHVRALCESRVVASEMTAGGQWRIPAAELQRLKRDGLPPLPRPLPDEIPDRKAGRSKPNLLGAPSAAVIESFEGVARKKALKEERELDLELLEIEDRFKDHEASAAHEEAERQREKRRQQLQADAQRRREIRDNQWQEYALNSVPSGAFGEVELDVHREVQAALDGLRLEESDSVVRRVVNAAVTKALAPWNRRMQIQKAVEEGRDTLPYDIKGWWSPSEWDIRARRAATDAICGLSEDASYDEMRVTAIAAVRKIIAEYEDQKVAAEDRAMRQRLIREAIVPSELTDRGAEMAVQAITEAINGLPQGTPRRKLEEARAGALRPFQEAIEKRRAEQQLKWQSEQDRRHMVGLVRIQVFDLNGSQQDQALAAVRTALDELPDGTPRQEMEAARDRALQPFLDRHASQKKKAELVSEALKEISPYLRILERDWEFDGGTWTLESELKPVVREQLDAEVQGDEPLDQVRKLVRRLVRQELDIT